MNVFKAATCNQPDPIDGISIVEMQQVSKDRAALSPQERFVQLSCDLTLVADLDWKILQVNSNWDSVMGFKPDEVEGRSIFDLIHPDECKEMINSLRKKHLIQKTIQFQVRMSCRDRTSRVIDFKLDVVPAEGLIYALGRDVTQQQQTEEALRDSESRRMAALDTTGDGIVTIDEQGWIASINVSVEKMFGYTWSELMGKNVSLLMPQPYKKNHDAYLKNYLRTGEKHVMGANREVVGLRKDGTQFPIELSIGEFQTARGRFFIGIIRDISQRKRIEELAHSRQKELHHASRLSLIGEMASGLAHEINQPLGAICSYADACKRLMRLGDRPELVHTIDKVAQQAERAGEIVRRIRRFVRKDEPRRSQVNVNSVLRETVGFIEADLHVYNVQMKLELSDQVTPITMDTIQLQQVALNLVRNALDSILVSGSDRQEIVIQTRMDQHDDVIISVSDTGTGMTGEVLLHLFDPFFTTKSDGMGLGLSISQSIVQSYDGKMWTEPNDDQGVTFYVKFPGLPGKPTGPV